MRLILRPLKNNKGYMLIEIILAFALAMVIMFFMTELTIKLKNKNDDMLVRTLVATDQAIIYNTIMRDLYQNYTGGKEFNGFEPCENVIAGTPESKNLFEYNKFKNIVSEYVTSLTFSCTNSDDSISIEVELEVPQLNDNFNVEIDFNRSDFEYHYYNY